MPFFRSIEQRDWASDLLDNGILPSYSRGGYIGVSSLKNSDVLTAVSHVASNVARFPYAIKDERTGDIVSGDELSYLLNKKPNANLDGYHWKFAMAVNAILSGDSYSRIVRDPISDKPAMLEFYLPSQTFLDDSNPNNLIYEFTPNNANRSIVEPAQNVIHWKFFSYDGIHGRSPLLSLGDEIGLQESGIDTLKRFFKSGLKGSILNAKGKLNKEARRKMREDFEYAQQGATGGSPVVVDETMEYKPLEVDTNVLQLINSNNYSTAQIAKALHVPAYKLAVNSPNQSIKQLNEDFIKSDLPYYFEPIVAELGLKLFDDLERHQKRFEVDTRKETGLSIDDAKKAIEGSLLTPNKALIESGRMPSTNPSMDKYQSTLNTVSLDMKDEYQKMKGGDKNDNRFGNATSNNDD
ncbi:phage portal protein [Latilactobacillus curvatus]|uniref:phage portal protein n=1 Tax=Latilactobacillus curvatus TaxID=28038 RepID=UPI0020C77716|nr:phage portal protein [Latilactobacillus curvatus]MCP8848943.1 phage portal protein [Latilactobacillus curvatus]